MQRIQTKTKTFDFSLNLPYVLVRYHIIKSDFVRYYNFMIFMTQTILNHPICYNSHKADRVCADFGCTHNSPFVCKDDTCDSEALHETCSTFKWSMFASKLKQSHIKKYQTVEPLFALLEEIFSKCEKQISEAHYNFRRWRSDFGLTEKEAYLERMIEQRKYSEMSSAVLAEVLTQFKTPAVLEKPSEEQIQIARQEIIETFQSSLVSLNSLYHKIKVIKSRQTKVLPIELTQQEQIVQEKQIQKDNMTLLTEKGLEFINMINEGYWQDKIQTMSRHVQQIQKTLRIRLENQQKRIEQQLIKLDLKYQQKIKQVKKENSNRLQQSPDINSLKMDIRRCRHHTDHKIKVAYQSLKQIYQSITGRFGGVYSYTKIIEEQMIKPIGSNSMYDWSSYDDLYKMLVESAKFKYRKPENLAHINISYPCGLLFTDLYEADKLQLSLIKQKLNKKIEQIISWNTQIEAEVQRTEVIMNNKTINQLIKTQKLKQLEQVTKLYEQMQAVAQGQNIVERFYLTDKFKPRKVKNYKSIFVKNANQSKEMFVKNANKSKETELKRFQMACENIPNTLIVMKNEYNKVFGGFTPVRWNFEIDNIQKDQKLESFLFSLTDKTKIPLINKDCAITNRIAFSGPTFGKGDLFLPDLSTCKVQLGSCYSNVIEYPAEQSSLVKFVGSINGRSEISNLEVYQVEFE